MNNTDVLFRSKELDDLYKLRKLEYEGNSIPKIIKKKPTKSQLRKYFLNIFLTNAFYNDKDGFEMPNKLYKFAHDLWVSKIKGVPFSKHNICFDRFLDKLKKLKTNEIIRLLQDYDLLPDYFYGLEKNGECYFFFFICTGIEYVSFDDDMFHFKCFNTDLSITFNSSYYEGSPICIESYLTKSNQLVFRMLNCREFYLIDKNFRDFKIDKVIKNHDGLLPLDISKFEKNINSDSYEINEVDILTDSLDSRVIFTRIEL